MRKRDDGGGGSAVCGFGAGHGEVVACIGDVAHTLEAHTHSYTHAHTVVGFGKKKGPNARPT